MLRTSTWLVRFLAVVVVGVASFTGSTASGSGYVTQVVAFAVGTLMLVLWFAVSRPSAPPHLRPRVLPAALAVMALCSVGVATPHDGGGLIAFGLLATAGAGAELTLFGGWAIAVIGTVAIEIGGLAFSASSATLLGYPLALFLGLVTGQNRSSYRKQTEQAHAMLAQMEELRAEQRQVAVLDERTRIAREIHDVLAHSLGALGIQLQVARTLLAPDGGADRDVPRAIAALETAQRMATDGLQETRRAVSALRTDTRPLAEELAALAETHTALHGVAVTVEVDGTVRPLAADAVLALLRTAQESLVNAAKHGPANPIVVRLVFGADATTLEVTSDLRDDAGRQRATKTEGDESVSSTELQTVNGGYGLIGMRERLLLLDGALHAGPHEGQWTVTAEVPR